MFERTSVVFWGVSLIGKALTLQVRSCQFESDMLHCIFDAFDNHQLSNDILHGIGSAW